MTERYVVKQRHGFPSYWHPDWLVKCASNGRVIAECWSKRSANRVARLLNEAEA